MRRADPLSWELAEIAIELTTCCNLRCAMCSVWEGKRHGPDEALARALLEAARGLGATSFVPCGGESFMRRDFVDLLAHADRIGYERSEVVTNGVLVSDHLAVLAKIPSVSLHVSIDGPAAVHDALRGPGVYQQAVDAVRGAREHGIRVGISGVLMKPTLATATHVVDLASELGVDEVSFQPFQPEIDGFERDHRRWLFEPGERSQVEDALGALRAHARERGVRIYTESILDHLPAYCFDGVRPIPPGGCYLPSRFVLVDVHGDVYPCFFMRDDVMGNVIRGDRLEDIWHGELHGALQMLAITSRCPGCLAACSDIASFEGAAS